MMAWTFPKHWPAVPQRYAGTKWYLKRIFINACFTTKSLLILTAVDPPAPKQRGTRASRSGWSHSNWQLQGRLPHRWHSRLRSGSKSLSSSFAASRLWPCSWPRGAISSLRRRQRFYFSHLLELIVSSNMVFVTDLVVLQAADALQEFLASVKSDNTSTVDPRSDPAVRPCCSHFLANCYCPWDELQLWQTAAF